MSKKFIYFLIISTIIATIFILYPEIDLYVSGLFYNENEGFFLNRNPVMVFLHDSVKKIVIICLSIYLLIFLNNKFFKIQSIKKYIKLNNKHILYLFLCLVIGPGIIVNSLFKDNWGRARPYYVEELGGTKEFTPAFVKTDQCERNCSFVSGDASMGYYFIAFAFLFGRKYRILWPIGIFSGLLFSTVRLTQGAHFFSDVIFAGVFVFITCYILHNLMYKKDLNSETS